VVSAESHLSAVQAAKNAGANSYIVKPFSGETLKQKIAEVLASDGAALCSPPHERQDHAVIKI
jgi:DNA-binding response OmpR family regulator